MAGLVVRSGVSLRARARGTLCPRSGDFPLGANKELVLRVLPRKQAFSTNFFRVGIICAHKLHRNMRRIKLLFVKHLHWHVLGAM